MKKTLALLGAMAVGQSMAPAQPGAMPVPNQGTRAGVAGFAGMQLTPAPRAAMPPLSAMPQPGMGLPVPAPLVAAKFLTPKGVRVTAYPGSSFSHIYDAPVVMGLRPGYAYRFALTNLPFNPGKSIYPEVELRGTLVPRVGMNYMNYPIPLTFSEDDIERVLRGAVITKVIYLEDPDKALPAEVGRDAPVEMPDSSERVAIKAALAGGRLMAIVRVGNRKPTPEQLRPLAVKGTILLPGEKRLKSPEAPPTLPVVLCPMWDPILGPKGPKEECFTDGGDNGDPLGITSDGRLRGLNPTDVGVEFTTGGKRKVATSNVVCICSPRFMVRRAEMVPGGVERPQVVAANIGAVGPGFLHERRTAMLNIALTRPSGVLGAVRPSAYVGKVGVGFYLGSRRPQVVGQIDGVKVTAALVEPEQLTAYPTLCPLTVTKSVDPPGPKEPGEVVTITIRYANTGAKEISDVVVSDSLSARLEYVPGSAVSDRASNFTVVENEVGSAVVRWELPGTILPGQAGVVKFKAKVR